MNENYDFKIVLLHDDPVSGWRGSSVLERLAGQLEMDSDKLVTDVWNFEALLQPEVRHVAGSKIQEANMIIISAAASAVLPAHMKSWFVNLLSRCRDQEVALVALLDGEQSPGGERPHLGVYLGEVAAKSGMDFFCNQGECQPPVKPVGAPVSVETDNSFTSSKNLVSCDFGRLAWGIND